MWFKSRYGYYNFYLFVKFFFCEMVFFIFFDFIKIENIMKINNLFVFIVLGFVCGNEIVDIIIIML